MDKQTKVVICTAAAYMLLSMMAVVIIKSRKRKRAARIEDIAYGPTEDGDSEEGNGNGASDGPNSPNEDGATSKASKTKKAKLDENAEEGRLIAAFNEVGDKLAAAIMQFAKSKNEVPDDLFDQVNSLSVSGFNYRQISMYYTHLVANPHIAKAFYNLPFDHKVHWMTMFVTEKIPGQ